MSENDLKTYIENKLSENFTKIADIKKDEKGEIFVYKHNKTQQMVLKRTSSNRNDEVYRLLKNKTHKNLTQILEVCSDEDKLIVLENFCSGKNLLQIISDGLPAKKAYKYIVQICEALDFLHKNGIIHRDIKPSNVIIADDNAVLVDLGIARLISQNEENDTENLGTIGYAAPEQFGLSQSGVVTDIYAVGVLLNIMLTGCHPTIKTPKGAIGKLIRKATSTQISKRYQKISDLKKALLLIIKNPFQNNFNKSVKEQA